MRFWRAILAAVIGLGGGIAARAQIDPAKRELLQFGYNQPLEGRAPLSGYAFYYLNLPDFYRTNLTLRLAVAPVYLDSELGFLHALGEHTDVGVGVSGGGFAESYAEIRSGKYWREESFTGHGAGVSASLYHLFNPGQLIPLNGVLRGEARYSIYERDTATAPNFVLPKDRGNFDVRTGVRWGGREPLMMPEVAMELSAWYEALFRTGTGPYGYTGDREVASVSHLFWGRALLAYTLPELKHSFNLSLTLGTSVNPDRFSTYRLGGLLPLAAEFPLTLPGYFYQEISARRFVLLGGTYTLPLTTNRQWSLNAIATTAGVDYLPGLEQPGRWHSGVGGGIIYRSPTDAWQLAIGYAYGVDALRHGERGAHSVGFLLQFDLERAKVNLFDPGENPLRSRGLERIFGLFH